MRILLCCPIRKIDKYVVLFLVFLCVPSWGADRPWEVSGVDRIVAFGDVHGAYTELTQLLTETKIIDSRTDWIAGKTHLVSLGDLIDRGPGSRKVLDLMIKLEQQANHAGGAVHTVLGNHEMMVMTGDYSYVSAAEFAAFADDESEEDRRKLFDGYRVYNAEIPQDQLKADFEKKYPPGFIALTEAFSTQGKYGQWLLRSPVVLKINNTLFVHGGLSETLVGYSLNAINGEEREKIERNMLLVESMQSSGVLPLHVSNGQRINYLNTKAATLIDQKALKERPLWFDETLELAELQNAFVFSESSPSWYRGSAMCHAYSESFNTERVLNKYGAERVVVGHTPIINNQVTSRLNGKVIMLDTVMLASVYKGQPAVMVIEGNRLSVHYAGGQNLVSPAIETRNLSREMADMSDAQMEDFLRTAKITRVENIGTGITKPKRLTLEKEGRKLNAIFKYHDSHPGLEKRRAYRREHDEADRFVYDIAAYLIDRMLDLQLVAVSVPRQVEGKQGIVQMWIPNTINERDRLKDEMAFNSYCNQTEQYRLRFIFDILIHNDDRNLTNILWDKKTYMLRFIDHTRAFSSRAKRPKQYAKVEVQLSDVLFDKLEELDANKLHSALEPYLHPKQIDAILARRDLLLEQAQRTHSR